MWETVQNADGTTTSRLVLDHPAPARRKPRPTPTERLVERLRARGYAVPDDAIVERTYAGHWQRSQGSWSWRLTYDPWPRDARGQRRAQPTPSPFEAVWRGMVDLGSQYPVSELLTCQAWDIDGEDPHEQAYSPDKSITPCHACQQRLAARRRK